MCILGLRGTDLVGQRTVQARAVVVRVTPRVNERSRVFEARNILSQERSNFSC